MSGKGFVISFDGLLALSVTLILFIAAASYLARVESSAVSSVSLREFSVDVAAVLEKSGMLERAVERDSVAEIRSFVNKMPEGVCIEVKVYGSGDLENAGIIVLRSGCTAVYEEKTSAKRGFLAGGSPSLHMAEVSAWYKVSS